MCVRRVCVWGEGCVWRGGVMCGGVEVGSSNPLPFWLTDQLNFNGCTDHFWLIYQTRHLGQNFFVGSKPVKHSNLFDD